MKITLGNLPAAVAKLEGLDDDTPEALAKKEKLYQDIIEGEGYDYARLLHDAWCAAFVWVKAKIEPGTDLTTKHLREIEANPHQVSPWRKRTIRELAGQYRFFHWHLEFPTVFDTDGKGGVDCILGNPPWERVKLQEKEFFAERSPDIADAPNTAARQRLINQLIHNNPVLLDEFRAAQRQADGETRLLRDSGLYPLCGRGDINLYAVFAEQARLRLAGQGYMSMVLPSGIATDDTTKFYFQNVVETESLVSLFDFENKGIFQGVHNSYKFCLFTAGSGRSLPASRKPGDAAEFVFFAHSVDDLNDTDSRFSLSAEDIALLNPNTRTCPIFRSRRDAELTKAVYRRVPVLIQEGSPPKNSWGISFLRMFDMSNDSHLFRTREQLEGDGWQLVGNVFERDGDRYLPLYEAKMTNQFDHRAADVVISETTMVRQGQSDTFDLADHKNPNRLPIPRYWVMTTVVSDTLGLVTHPKALLSFTDVTSPTNERTMIATILPFSGVGHTKPLIFPTENLALTSILQANVNSFMFDYISRQKLGGIHFTYFILRQLPVLPPETYAQPCTWIAGIPSADYRSSLANFLLPRVLELTYTAWDLEAFAQDCGFNGPPFRWDDARRFLLRCELDAAYFHLYGIERDDVDYIMDTFPIVKRRDESAHGEYRTKRVILEIYDAMRLAMDTGKPYQTRLDPPPADPRCCHPPRDET